MANEKIVVKIQPNGEILVETLGIKGEACLDVIDLMEQLLQAETVDSSYTKEYFEQQTKNTNTQHNTIRRT